MPLRSQAQRAFLHIHHPGVARKFEEETPRGAKLPYKIGKDGQGPIARLFDRKGKAK